jgi:hypothetical protein
MSTRDERRASYRDIDGNEHQIVRRDRLILDTIPGNPTRVICELDRLPVPRNKKQAIEQRESQEAEIKAVIDRYIEQAAFTDRPLARAITAEDLAPRPGEQIHLGV